MTIPPVTSLSITFVSSVLLPDLVWHDVIPGSVIIDREPVFTDQAGEPVAGPNGPWLGFAGQDGHQYGCALTDVKGVRWALPPVTGTAAGISIAAAVAR